MTTLRLIWLWMGIVALWPAVHAQQPVTLERIMADPDWIGQQPESPYWDDDGTAVFYNQKRDGEWIRDQYRVAIANGQSELVAATAMPTSANASRRFNTAGDAVVWVEHGDVFVRDWPVGEIRQLTRTSLEASQAQFTVDGRAVLYLEGAQFMRHDLASGQVRQLLDLRFEDDPEQEASFDTLRANQERIYTTVVEDARRAKALAQQSRDAQSARAGGAPLPLYLGKAHTQVGAALSPSGRHLLLVTEPANHDAGQSGVMPNYMTASGYTETRELRPRVGRNAPAPDSFWLVDIETNSASQISLADLPGIDDDPLAALRESALEWHIEHGQNAEAVEAALVAPDQRGVLAGAIEWSADGRFVAVQMFSIDNKDRWLATVDTQAEDGSWQAQHRLTDPAWVNYAHNDFGWLSDSRTLWLLSEESGYSHLYRKRLGERRHKAITRGKFVVSDVVRAHRSDRLFVRSNKPHPSNWEIFSVDASDGALQQHTQLGGVNHFVLSADDAHLAVLHSEFDKHPDLFHVALDGPAVRQLTDTRTDAYKSYDWVIPKIVEVPSSHVDRPIYTKLYLPREYDSTRQYPAVMFVHGAGYTQNAHAGWPYYFREFMFHTLLADLGVIVIDMDYRASKGYGREWRTAIYRQMGHPELEDFQDGVAWLVENYGVDPQRVGVYGGSYGGFMTFMAMFRDPDLFAAGAALRPVVDWAHYNHGYTSNILNTPLVDPVAYEKSSPIFYADGLTKPLLIAAGMQDDNVFFQDSVLLVQRLIELQKPDFELAVYPLDPHGFTHADSWLDEYRRVLKLMQRYVINPDS
ncbi:MAG: prolyl oligopeptidase family serine peptidase [Pseudomonadota bacterium]